MGDPVTMAAGLSLASAGIGAVGKGVSAFGTSEADQFRAQQLEESAQYGELKATQVGAQMTRNLGITLGNIDAIRAAGHDSPLSPTAAAVRGNVEQVGEEQRGIEVASIQEQARMDEDQAAYLRSASSTALLGGGLDIAGGIAGGLGGAFKSGGINIPGFNPIANVTGQ